MACRLRSGLRVIPSCAVTPTCRTSGCSASPERDLVFDVNDFDETLPGPFEWDVKRLVASFVLASRDRGFKRKEARTAVRAALQAYRAAITEPAQLGTLDVRYTRIDEQMLLDAIAQMGSQHGKGKGDREEGHQDGDGRLRRGAAEDLDEGRAEVDRGRGRPPPVPGGPAAAVPGGHRGVPRAWWRWASRTTGRRCPRTGAGCSSATT